jgi:riboflavin biosynthesis pyrimidine reductase
MTTEAPVAISSLTDAQLANLYAWPEGSHLRLNMVVNRDGLSVGSDGTSASLTSAQDRRLLRLIRSNADVVISGGASIRAEGWFLPPRGALAVVSQSGDLPWNTCPDRTRVTVLPTLAALSHFLRSQTGSVLCEGGTELAAMVEKVHGFDDVALTTLGSQPLSVDAVGLTAADFALAESLNDDAPTATFCLWRRAVTNGFSAQT